MSEKKVVLGVGAHADDMDFTSSGTIAKLIAEGWDAYYLVATDGSRGSADPQMTHERLAEIREKEQRAAAKILGLKDIFFLSHTDTQLVSDLQLKEEIVKIIRQIKPTVVITMDPTFYYYSGDDFGFVNHTDHRAAGLATLDAVFPMARDRLTFPQHEQEGLLPHKVDELWLVNFTKPNYVVDITNYWDKKVEVLTSHKSQYSDVEEFLKVIKERSQLLGKENGYTYAENFTRILMP